MAHAKKRSLSKVIVGEVLFWLHFCVALGMVLAGLFVSWYWFLLIIPYVIIQGRIFHGCVITILEEKDGAIPRGMVYYQVMAKRFLHYRLKKHQIKPVAIAHNMTAVGVVALANIYHIRIHF